MIYVMMAFTVLKNCASIWGMARLVANAAVILIDQITQDSSIVGVLDQSFLGLAVM